MSKGIRILSIVTATLIVVYLIVVSYYFNVPRNNMICKEIQVVVKDSLKEHFVSERDLMQILKKSKINPLKKTMQSINTELIEQEILKNQMVASVEAYKTPSGIIRLEVEQKIPILRVLSVNENYYVDNNGEFMPISLNYVVDVPVATGYVEKEFAKSELYKFALFLQENDFWNNLIVQMVVEDDRDLVLIPRVGDCRIVLGSLENYEEKLNNLMLFYKQAIPKVGWDKYRIINLKYKNQVVCTKKQI